MDFYSLTDKAIETELGKRLRSLRLRKNITQKELANATALSLNAIKALESGRAKLSTIIAVLRELEALDDLDNFIPQVAISPLQLAKRDGKVRQRASRSRKSGKNESDEDEPAW